MQTASYVANPNLRLPDIGDKVCIDYVKSGFRLFVKNSIGFTEVDLLPGMVVWIEGVPPKVSLDYGLGGFHKALVTQDMSLHIVGDRDRDYDIPIRALAYPSVTIELMDIKSLEMHFPTKT